MMNDQGKPYHIICEECSLCSCSCMEGYPSIGISIESILLLFLESILTTATTTATTVTATAPVTTKYSDSIWNR